MSNYEVGDTVRVIGKGLEPYDLRVGTVEKVAGADDSLGTASYRVSSFLGEPVLSAQWFAPHQIEAFPPVTVGGADFSDLAQATATPIQAAVADPIPPDQDRRKWIFDTVLGFAERYNASEAHSSMMTPEDILTMAWDTEYFLTGQEVRITEYNSGAQVGMALAADEMFAQQDAQFYAETDQQEGTTDT